MSILTSNQATKVLEDFLVLLASPPAHAPARSSTNITLHQYHYLYRSNTAVPSLNRLVESILVLNNINTLLFVETFLARVYNILIAALQQSTYSQEPQLNTPLMIVDMLISAGHIALYQTQKHQSIGTPIALGTGPSMIFEQLVVRVLEPMTHVVHMSYSNQYFTHDMKAKLLSSCEMVLSSIVVSLLKAVEQYDGASNEYLSEPILACARVFDETILQLHTGAMNEMTVDHASLVSGAFALLRLMDHLSAVPGMQQAKRLLMHVLCSSDILEWTVLSIQTRPELNHVQMFQGFLTQVVKVHEMFVESHDGIGFLQGNRMPSVTYCIGLSAPHWALSLKVDDTAVNNTDDSLERQETKRLAIAFIYLKVATKGPALESQELLDAITSLVIMEPALDYLHGSSWIQLTWLYITASNNLGSPVPEPLVQHRIMEGLNATLGSADSIAHTVLGHHIESIQLWFWRMTTEQHSSKISDLLLPNLLLDWITRRAPNKALGETQHFGNQELNAISMHIISYPKALSALKTLFTNYLATVIDPDSTKKENAQMVFDLVCSTIECCCRSLQDLAPDLNPAPVEKGSLAESQHRFFGRVLSDSLDVLTKEAFSTEEGTNTGTSTMFFEFILSDS
ncbi:hypothetical protein MVEG_11400 [Podila verticillata NRRL 6337]|uniref:Uncharacterized protein n=1 Tax=Podila verticillata NRRL 6337 TaxID=1069443 RepID=A0A086TLP9_9FUNG|nr:hypothetical protein MVEG_11400 [Podila verticillata NRRL 6337]